MGQVGHKQKQDSAEYGRYSKNKKVRDSYESASSVKYSGNEPCLPSFSMKNEEKACNLSFQELEIMDNRNLSMEHNTAQNMYEMDQICVERMPNMYPVEPGENHSYGGPVGQEIWCTEVDFNPHYTNRTSYNDQGFGMEPSDSMGTSNNVRVQINIPNMPEVQINQNESTENMDMHYQNSNTVEGDMSGENRIILPYNTLYSQVEIHPKPSDFECNHAGEQCYYQCVNTGDEISSDERNNTVSFIENAYTDTAKTTEPLLDIQRNLMESVAGNTVDISAIDVIETRRSPSCSYDEDGQSIEEIDTNTDIKDETAGTSSGSSVVHRMVARTVKKISLLSDLIRQWKCNAEEKDCFDELQRMKKKLFINPKEVLGSAPPQGLALSMTNLVSKVLSEASSVEKDIHPYGRGNMYTNAFAGKKSLVKLDPGKLMFWGIVICMVTGAAFGVIILSEIHRGSLKRLLQRYNGSFPDWY